MDHFPRAGNMVFLFDEVRELADGMNSVFA